MEMGDRHKNIKYSFMARSAEEGKKYLDEHKEELNMCKKLGYVVVCIGGYLMANEEAEPEKVAFILIVEIGCLKHCPFNEVCIAKTIADGCRKVEKLEDGILALEPHSRSVEHH